MVSVDRVHNLEQTNCCMISNFSAAHVNEPESAQVEPIRENDFALGLLSAFAVVLSMPKRKSAVMKSRQGNNVWLKSPVSLLFHSYGTTCLMGFSDD